MLFHTIRGHNFCFLISVNLTKKTFKVSASPPSFLSLSLLIFSALPLLALSGLLPYNTNFCYCFFLLFLFISTYITTTLNFGVALFAKGRIFPDPKRKNFTLYANMKNKTCCRGRFTLTSVSVRVNISSSAMRSSANLSRFEFFGF